MSHDITEEVWDVIVIGGGITGAGLLRELVRNKFKTLLIEQKDFAWGTSSRSSKLVHGGLRYLKEGHFGLTRESVRERERLIKNAPGLVTTIPFHMPLYKKRKPGKWAMKTGLAIYDMISGKWTHAFHEKDVFSRMEPLVKKEGLIGGFSFIDAQVDDARLVMRLINESEQNGGVALNYTKAVSLVRNEHGRVTGLEIEDVESKTRKKMSAGLVINATGAWAENIHPSPEKNRHLRPLRGSHLVFPAHRIPIENTVSFFSHGDGRHLFAIPWEGAVLVGTTDIDHRRPLNEEPRATVEEIDYLMKGINAIFPSLNLTVDDAISSFAGVRPVVSEGKVSADKESRDHVIWKEKGLVTVTGGKLTTFRALAYDTLRAACDELPGKNIIECTDDIFEGANGHSCHGKLPEERFKVLWGRYGNKSLAMIEKSCEQDLELIPGTKTSWGELRHVAASEKVRHLDDLLLRRVRLGLLLEKGAIPILGKVRSICEPVMPWSDERWVKEIDDYSRLWNDCYSPVQKDIT